jgi:hypothetical protein
MASRAIPSHLKPSAAAGKDEGGFNSQRHHGKSQSHVVSYPSVPAASQTAAARLPLHFGDNVFNPRFRRFLFQARVAQS